MVFQRGHVDGPQAYEKMVTTANHQGKGKQSHVLTPVTRPSSKGTQITDVGENVEKREPLTLLLGSVNWCSHGGKGYGGFSEN